MSTPNLIELQRQDNIVFKMVKARKGKENVGKIKLHDRFIFLPFTSRSGRAIDEVSYRLPNLWSRTFSRPPLTCPNLRLSNH